MDLAKFGYKLNVKVKVFKTSIYILGYITWTKYRNLEIFVHFGLILATQNLQKTNRISGLIRWQACTI
jgi:hypothetical protein